VNRFFLQVCGLLLKIPCTEQLIHVNLFTINSTATFILRIQIFLPFLDILLNFQAETYVKINSAQRSVKKLRCNTKKKQEFIKTTIIELYKSGNLSRLHFVKKLSFYYFLRITGLIS
jgi:hypothetical protein